MPVGYGFRPTDEELVGHYLSHKLLGDDDSIHDTISEIDICKYEPWDLPAFSKNKSDDPEWFFFSPIKYKYSNSTRSSRTTSGGGYWKATGKDRKIRDPVTNNVIGTKKTLVFYKGQGIKNNNWVIHEYHHDLFTQNERTHVLCKLLKKPLKKTNESQPNDHIAAAEYENQANSEEQYYMIQRPRKSNGFVGCSRIQTSSEVNSTDESDEFDVDSFFA